MVKWHEGLSEAAERRLAAFAKSLLWRRRNKPISLEEHQLALRRYIESTASKAKHDCIKISSIDE